VRPLIVANWKCNPTTLAEAKQIFNSVKRGTRNVCSGRSRKVEVVICPPFVYLPSLTFTGKPSLGAQNCFFEGKGAFTGEVSPAQLRKLGCQYVILGHSERRRYFGESDEIINKKVKKSLEFKLDPILCVGESQDQREKNETINVLQTQIKKALKKVTKKEMQKIVIAYEPIWAIGSGQACPPDLAQSMGLLIKKIIAQIYGKIISKNLRVLYGGSITSENAASYIKEAHLDGLLVGGASLKPEEFIKIIKVVRG
jgi:triosephosphate isomerase